MRYARWVSIDMLADKLKEVLPESYLVTFPPRQEWPRKRTVDVVFLGDGPVSLLTLRPPKEVRQLRLWSFSNSHARLTEKFWGWPSGTIGCIDRHVIFPRMVAPMPFPDPSEPFTLVSACRFHRPKNFWLSVLVTGELQKLWKSRIDSALCGPRLFEYDSSQWSNFCQVMGLDPHPTMHGDLGPGWLRKLKVKKPVLISLSVDFREDFGVSVAQADQAGWPLILSDWGAHRDIQRPGVIKVPLRLLEIGGKMPSDKNDTQELAQYIYEQMTAGRQAKVQPVTPPSPRAVSVRDFAQRVNSIDLNKVLHLRAMFSGGIVSKDPVVANEAISILSPEGRP